MKLEDFMSVERFFRDTGISANWLKALSYGETFIFVDCLLCYYYENGILVINSGSIGDVKFNIGILKMIKELIESNERVIISSSVESISSHMIRRYGFVYNDEAQVYIKGI